MSLVHNNRLNKYQLEKVSFRSSNGKLWTSPSHNKPSAYGSASGLLAVEAISCLGCDVIRSSSGYDGTFDVA